MTVGTPAAIATAIQNHAATSGFPHAALAAAPQHRNAAVLELADRLLGVLSDAIVNALGVATPARRVLMRAATQRHAIARRQLATQIDADLVGTRLDEALADPRYLRTPQRAANVYEVIGYSEAAARLICLPIKLVPAVVGSNKQDEWWAKTAFPIGAKTFRRLLAQGELIELKAGELPKPYL